MPAGPAGQIIMTATDGTGTPILVTTIKYNPATLVFDVTPAISVVNTTGKTVQAVISMPDASTHQVSVPVGTTNITPGQLSALGVTSWSQLAGVSLAVG